MAVIPHHPEIIHLKSIGCYFISIKEEFAVLFVKIILFVHADGAFVNFKGAVVELNLSAFVWNPDRAVIIGCPVILQYKRIR